MLYKLPAGAVGKLEARWDKGLWLGKTNISDEHMIGTAERGRVYCRTIQRRPEEKRWPQKLIAQVIATPFEPQKSLVEPVAAPRQRYLTKAVLDKYGRAGDCPACLGLGSNTPLNAANA